MQPIRRFGPKYIWTDEQSSENIKFVTTRVYVFCLHKISRFGGLQMLHKYAPWQLDSIVWVRLGTDIQKRKVCSLYAFVRVGIQNATSFENGQQELAMCDWRCQEAPNTSHGNRGFRWDSEAPPAYETIISGHGFGDRMRRYFLSVLPTPPPTVQTPNYPKYPDFRNIWAQWSLSKNRRWVLGIFWKPSRQHGAFLRF